MALWSVRCVSFVMRRSCRGRVGAWFMFVYRNTVEEPLLECSRHTPAQREPALMDFVVPHRVISLLPEQTVALHGFLCPLRYLTWAHIAERGDLTADRLFQVGVKADDLHFLQGDIVEWVKLKVCLLFCGCVGGCESGGASRKCWLVSLFFIDEFLSLPTEGGI